MRHSIALCALAILLLVTSNFSAAQRCEETPTGQIKNVLDRSANRVLQREIVGSYGEEGKHILIKIAGDNAQPLNRREGAIRLLGVGAQSACLGGVGASVGSASSGPRGVRLFGGCRAAGR